MHLVTSVCLSLRLSVCLDKKKQVYGKGALAPMNKFWIDYLSHKL